MDVVFQQLANALVLGSAYCLVALGLYLVYSTLHFANFAHGAMYALGAYFLYTFAVVLSLPFWLSAVLSVLAGAAVGALLEITLFRRMARSSGFTVLVGTLAVAIVLQEIIGLVWGHDSLGVGSPSGDIVTLGPVRMPLYRLIVIGVTLLVSLLIGYLVYRTDYGRALRAIAQSREIAELSGVNVRVVTLATFALSGALASLGGALLAPTTALDTHMGFTPVIVAFAILVVIGPGARLMAVVFGAFAIAIVETVAAAYVANAARTWIVFLALVIFLIVRPEGAVRLAYEPKVRL